MNKLAQVQVVAEEIEGENPQGSKFDSDPLFLKEKKEDEIRMKLDEFAHELSKVRRQRKKH